MCASALYRGGEGIALPALGELAFLGRAAGSAEILAEIGRELPAGWAGRAGQGALAAAGPTGAGLPERHLPSRAVRGRRLPALPPLAAGLGALPPCPCRSRAQCGGSGARPVPAGESLLGVVAVVVPKCLRVPPKNFLWDLCLLLGLVLFPCLELIKTHARYGSCLFPARRRFGLFNFFFPSSPFSSLSRNVQLLGPVNGDLRNSMLARRQ